MPTPSRIRRVFATALAFAVLAGSLVASPLSTSPASAATNATQAKAVLTKVNAARAAAGLGKLGTEPLLSSFAQEVGDYFAENNNISELDIQDITLFPAYGDYEEIMAYRLKGTSASTMPTALAELLMDASSKESGSYMYGSFSHAGIGYAVKSGYTYVFAFLVTYDEKLQTPVKPTISGTLAVGKTLTAVVKGWSPSNVTFQYRWSMNGNTVGNGKTLKLTSDLRGKRIVLEVGAFRSGYEGLFEYSRESKAIAFGTLNAKTPTVTGSRTVRQTLTAVPGNWGSGVTFTYQWLRDGSAISGATDATYTQTATDRNKKITVKVVGKAVAYNGTTKYSAAPAQTAGAFVPAQATLRGTPKAGNTLTAVRGTWSPAPTSWEYRWYRDGSRIAGAAKNSYTLTTADRGRAITVTIVGARAGYRSGTSTSAAVTVATN